MPKPPTPESTARQELITNIGRGRVRGTLHKQGPLWFEGRYKGHTIQIYRRGKTPQNPIGWKLYRLLIDNQVVGYFATIHGCANGACDIINKTAKYPSGMHSQEQFDEMHTPRKMNKKDYSMAPRRIYKDGIGRK